MLKSLELSGFKSFAEKTRFEFPPGVTMVVGPNGSGKSNVVDAIRWVLGSQSPRSLRGEGMTDVIFNGAAGMRPLGGAEVTLTLDNAGRSLPLDADEVRIARRIYRSGEAEYQLNGRPARLRDVRELLAGSGIGDGAYSIIEQGRVDAVLHATPAERRVLFEEAAGVCRLRIKQIEAARRLDRVEQNLLRLKDVVAEVDARLERVRGQAGKARRHREHSERLKRIRSNLAVADWRAATAQIAELELKKSGGSGELEALAQQIEQGAQRLRELDTQLDTMERSAEQASRAYSTAAQRSARESAMGAALNSRVAELSEQVSACRRAAVAAALEVASLGESRSAETAESLAQLDHEVATAAQKVELGQQELADLSAAIRQANLQSQELETSLDSLRGSLREANLKREMAQVQTASLIQGLAARRAALQGAREAAERATVESVGANQRRDAAIEAKRNADEQRERLTAEVALVQRRLAEAQMVQAVAAARIAALEQQSLAIETSAQHNGSVRAELERLPTSSGRPVEVLGQVHELFDVDVDLAGMVASALGDRAAHWIIDCGGAPEMTLQAAAKLGIRATLEVLPTPQPILERIDLQGEAGVMGRADAFVAAKPRLLPLVRRLLAGVWFVDTLSTAWRLAPLCGRGIRLVTYAGEVVASEGSITLGPSGADADGLGGGRQEALLAAQQNALQHRSEVERAATESATLAPRLEDLRKAEADAALAASELAEALGRQEHAAIRAAERLDSIRSQLAAETAASAREAAAFEAAQTEQGAIADRIAALSRSLAELEPNCAAARVGLDSLTARREQAFQELQDAKLELASLQQRAEMAHQGAGQQGAELEAARSRASEALLTLGAVQRSLEAVTLEALQSRGRDSAALVDIEAADRRRREFQEERSSVVLFRRELAAALEAARRRYDSLSADTSRAEVEAARYAEQRAALVRRMRDDYGLDLPRLAQDAASPAQATEASREQLEAEMAELRRQLQALGHVNLESLAELDELENRFARLSAQYADLSEARSALVKLSGRIDREGRQLYLATVEAARGHFREAFRQLFGGGEADLVLTEPQDASKAPAGETAETAGGVEIVARPPGKELRSLALLSGGEKTLTCLALLLALFRLKPSPFCVLDEVDAALDEANIERLSRAIVGLRDTTQFIVVTHSKKTMTVADTLYGVTMQQAGLSKLVAVRFEDVDAQGNVLPSVLPIRSAA